VSSVSAAGRGDQVRVHMRAAPEGKGRKGARGSAPREVRLRSRHHWWRAGAGADSQGQGEEGHHGESGALPQLSRPGAQVTPQPVHHLLHREPPGSRVRSCLRVKRQTPGGGLAAARATRCPGACGRPLGCLNLRVVSYLRAPWHLAGQLPATPAVRASSGTRRWPGHRLPAAPTR